MSLNRNTQQDEVDVMDMPVRGTNFLVSAIMILRKQKTDLQSQVRELQEKVAMLERQNAGFIEISAQRLIHH